MAHNNIEIEIRIPLDGDSFSKVKERLSGIAKFVKSSSQKDEYFTPPHLNFLEVKFPFEWLSIRKRDNDTILNYKRYYPENAEIMTHCDEFETKIEDPNQLEKVLSALNFKKLVTVEKEREVYAYNDEFEISLDMVKELGNFIEIEIMKDFGSIETAREKLFDFAKNLGIDTSKEARRGYAFLMAKKKGLIKE